MVLLVIVEGRAISSYIRNYYRQIFRFLCVIQAYRSKEIYILYMEMLTLPFSSLVTKVTNSHQLLDKNNHKFIAFQFFFTRTIIGLLTLFFQD